MSKEMLINVSEGEECRIALLDNGKLEELYMERTSSTSHVGNIYKGRVTNVEASIQAAFVDFGLGRNGFLHISDVMPSYFGGGREDVHESVGRKMARRDRPPIQRCLRRGDEIIVQIIKEGIGTKGPTLSTYLSIPGRILVMMPGMGKMGVSRKIEDEEERRRLRQILDGLKPPRDVGFIIRTAGVGKTKAEIERDLKYLTRLWENIEKKAESSAPLELYTEGDLVTRTVRDVFTTEIDRIIVDNKEVARKIKEFFKIAMPRTRNKVDLYEEGVPLFHKYGIEREIEQMYSRHVPLPSGGSLVIDSTEAIVAIDVNSGKFREHSDAETTAFKTDLEAADEIPRQLKLRDLGGVIICDFIDLRFERHRRDLEKRLHDNFRKDRAKTKVLRMSQFGIIELTRQRMRPSLKRSIYFDCPHCKGSGLVKTPESMSLDVMRRLAIAAHDQRVARIEMSVCNEVAFYLQNKKRAQLSQLESHSRKRIVVRADTSMGLDEIRLTLFDARDGLVFIDALGMSTQDAHGNNQNAQRRQGRGDQRDQRGRRGQSQQQPQRRHEPEVAMDERYLLDNAEDAVEEREITQSQAPSRILPPPPPMPADEDSDDQENLQSSSESSENDSDEASNETSDENNAEPDAPRRGRRRGRRGRRGRGRGQSPTRDAESELSSPIEDSQDENSTDLDESPSAEQPDQDSSDTSSDSDEPVDSGESDDESSAPRRRRRRGGRRHRSGSKTGRNGDAPAEPAESPRQQPQSTVTPQRPAPPPPMPVVRTGSTDRHLMSDEPVNPEPVRRPRSYRDLDAIPDDLD
ncbi:MAG: Rne/Rng family ribonuclease [Phycisphaerales bacterium]|nr:Rne/Rng family ribonuclease [Phycisphaerales bacterium]